MGSSNSWDQDNFINHLDSTPIGKKAVHLVKGTQSEENASAWAARINQVCRRFSPEVDGVKKSPKYGLSLGSDETLGAGSNRTAQDIGTLNSSVPFVASLSHEGTFLNRKPVEGHTATRMGNDAKESTRRSTERQADIRRRNERIGSIRLENPNFRCQGSPQTQNFEGREIFVAENDGEATPSPLPSPPLPSRCTARVRTAFRSQTMTEASSGFSATRPQIFEEPCKVRDQRQCVSGTQHTPCERYAVGDVFGDAKFPVPPPTVRLSEQCSNSKGVKFVPAMDQSKPLSGRGGTSSTPCSSDVQCENSVKVRRGYTTQHNQWRKLGLLTRFSRNLSDSALLLLPLDILGSAHHSGKVEGEYPTRRHRSISWNPFSSKVTFKATKNMFSSSFIEPATDNMANEASKTPLLSATRELSTKDSGKAAADEATAANAMISAENQREGTTPLSSQMGRPKRQLPVRFPGATSECASSVAGLSVTTNGAFQKAIGKKNYKEKPTKVYGRPKKNVSSIRDANTMGDGCLPHKGNNNAAGELTIRRGTDDERELEIQRPTFLFRTFPSLKVASTDIVSSEREKATWGGVAEQESSEGAPEDTRREDSANGPKIGEEVAPLHIGNSDSTRSWEICEREERLRNTKASSRGALRNWLPRIIRRRQHRGPSFRAEMATAYSGEMPVSRRTPNACEAQTTCRQLSADMAAPLTAYFRDTRRVSPVANAQGSVRKSPLPAKSSPDAEYRTSYIHTAASTVYQGHSGKFNYPLSEAPVTDGISRPIRPCDPFTTESEPSPKPIYMTPTPSSAHPEHSQASVSGRLLREIAPHQYGSKAHPGWKSLTSSMVFQFDTPGLNTGSDQSRRDPTAVLRPGRKKKTEPPPLPALCPPSEPYDPLLAPYFSLARELKDDIEVNELKKHVCAPSVHESNCEIVKHGSAQRSIEGLLTSPFGKGTSLVHFHRSPPSPPSPGAYSRSHQIKEGHRGALRRAHGSALSGGSPVKESKKSFETESAGCTPPYRYDTSNAWSSFPSRIPRDRGHRTKDKEFIRTGDTICGYCRGGEATVDNSSQHGTNENRFRLQTNRVKEGSRMCKKEMGSNRIRAPSSAFNCRQDRLLKGIVGFRNSRAKVSASNRVLTPGESWPLTIEPHEIANIAIRVQTALPTPHEEAANNGFWGSAGNEVLKSRKMWPLTTGPRNNFDVTITAQPTLPPPPEGTTYNRVRDSTISQILKPRGGRPLKAGLQDVTHRLVVKPALPPPHEGTVMAALAGIVGRKAKQCADARSFGNPLLKTWDVENPLLQAGAGGKVL